MPLQRELAEDT